MPRYWERRKWLRANEDTLANIFKGNGTKHYQTVMYTKLLFIAFLVSYDFANCHLMIALTF
jgi:hypothetical protein